ncbi:MAG: DUF4422 domain-containing protein, partial [Clostridium sp.]
MKEISEIKILVATHKKANIPKEENYIPIHVGREGKEELGYLGDNTGTHISMKNANFCELTGLYWYLKNKVKENSLDFVGLNHYRRYFMKDEQWLNGSAIIRID